MWRELMLRLAEHRRENRTEIPRPPMTTAERQHLERQTQVYHKKLLQNFRQRKKDLPVQGRAAVARRQYEEDEDDEDDGAELDVTLSPSADFSQAFHELCSPSFGPPRRTLRVADEAVLSNVAPHLFIQHDCSFDAGIELITRSDAAAAAPPQLGARDRPKPPWNGSVFVEPQAVSPERRHRQAAAVPVVRVAAADLCAPTELRDSQPQRTTAANKSKQRPSAKAPAHADPTVKKVENRSATHVEMRPAGAKKAAVVVDSLEATSPMPLGQHSAAELGLLDAVPSSEWEDATRPRLEHMNINLRAHPRKDGVPHHSFSSPLEDPIRNGAALCQLLGVIGAVLPNCVHHEGAAPQPILDCINIFEAREQILRALQFLRCLKAPHRRDSVPHMFLHLKVDDVLRQPCPTEMWGLLHYLVQAFFPVSSEVAPPIVARQGGMYSFRNMARLDGGICQFLLDRALLFELPSSSREGPAGNTHDDSLLMAISQRMPGALDAPYIHPDPNRRVLRTAAAPRSVYCRTIFPYLLNGVLLCEIVSSVLNVELPVQANPRLPSRCIANIAAAQGALRSQQPRISSMFLADPYPVYEGDRVFILFLLEDVMRLAAGAPPRSRPPGIHETPFWYESRAHVPQPKAVAIEAAKGKPPGGKHGGEADARRPGKIVLGVAHRLAEGLNERQRFVAHPPVPTVRISNTHLHREGSAASSAPGDEYEDDVQNGDVHKFTETAAPKEGPAVLRLRGPTAATTVPSSGRSVAYTDDADGDGWGGSEGSAEEAPRPQYLAFLDTISATTTECDHLRLWLLSKLGAGFAYRSPKFSVRRLGEEVHSLVPLTTSPCYLFEDGVILAELIRVLCYHENIHELDCIQRNPKNSATKKFNLKRCLSFVARNKKILTETLFLEDALVDGDVRAVILVLRSLASAFGRHRTGTVVSAVGGFGAGRARSESAEPPEPMRPPVPVAAHR